MRPKTTVGVADAVVHSSGDRAAVLGPSNRIQKATRREHGDAGAEGGYPLARSAGARRDGPEGDVELHEHLA